MKGLIASFILLVGIFGCATTGENYKQEQLNGVAWAITCDLLENEGIGYLCMRMMPPMVHYEKMRPGLYGYYDGGPMIYVNSELNQQKTINVLIHEQVHYIHVQLQILSIPGPAREVCWSENEAWKIEGLYSGQDNSLWWKYYPHCWEWYAETQYQRDVGFVYNTVNDIIDQIILEN